MQRRHAGRVGRRHDRIDDGLDGTRPAGQRRSRSAGTGLRPDRPAGHAVGRRRNTITGFSFTADTNFQEIVSQFKNVCLDDILNLLSNVADELQGSNLPILNVEIPLLNQSLGELIDFGDGLVDAASRFLASVDLSDVEDALDDLDTAISNLSLSLPDRDRLFRMGDLLRGLTSQPEQAPGESAGDFQTRLNDFVERLPSKLLSGLIQLGKIINVDVPDGTVGKGALETAFAKLADLLPSWNTLADRLETGDRRRAGRSGLQRRRHRRGLGFRGLRRQRGHQ